MKAFATPIIATSLFIGMVAPLRAADAPTHAHAAASATSDDVRCVPVEQRAGKTLGCYVLAREPLGELSKAPVYWHLYEYPSRAAADSAKGKQGTVIESYGKVWLLNVGEAAWSAAGGKKVARVGPLPVEHGGSYTAVYMEATFMPGMKSQVHRHPGPEAWYVLKGEQCLETPGHKAIVRAGESGIVPEGPPMMLTGIGTGERRSLVLILHDSAKPMTLPATDWKPTGSCLQGG
jgi:quercetin dioxygenase-like cupin family protein